MTAIVWFRQDLRLNDNPALQAALKTGLPLVCVYIHAPHREGSWKMGGAQKWWLHHSLSALDQDLQAKGVKLILRQGDPQAILQEIIAHSSAKALFWNRCYEPYAIKQAQEIKNEFKQQGLHVESFNASMLYEPWEIQNQQGQYYKVFSQFWKTLQAKGAPRKPHKTNWESVQHYDNLPTDTLEDWDLLPQNPNWAKEFSDYWKPGEQGAQHRLEAFIENAVLEYKQQRDLPAIEGTSRLSPHLHFGEISPNQIWYAIVHAHGDNLARVESFLRQLGWREFCTSILYHAPDIPHSPFRKEFSAFPWSSDEETLSRWQRGQTGYPIVDAGMRQLWTMGWMHNRVRMIVASFLTKDLFMNWTEGEAWFWDTLVDADLANNACGWQWVAGCGTDAQPYFRIFNPILQSKKVDPQGAYIRRWVPELGNLKDSHIHAPWEAPPLELSKAGIGLGKTYPHPMVDHKTQRDKALEAYKFLNMNNII